MRPMFGPWERKAWLLTRPFFSKNGRYGPCHIQVYPDTRSTRGEGWTAVVIGEGLRDVWRKERLYSSRAAQLLADSVALSWGLDLSDEVTGSHG